MQSCLLISSDYKTPGLCRSINPHITPTLDAFRRAPQPAGSSHATGRSADGGTQLPPPPLGTYAARQAGATPLGSRSDRSVSGISSFAFQVHDILNQSGHRPTLRWRHCYMSLT